MKTKSLENSTAATTPFALQEAYGWNSLAMSRRYVDEKAILTKLIFHYSDMD
jgi:hypothetical protein